MGQALFSQQIYQVDTTIMTIFLQMITQSGYRPGIQVHLLHLCTPNHPPALSHGKDFILACK